jgi:hypothetical protein
VTQIERPKLQRCYITVVDAETRKSGTLTVYGATKEQIIDTIRATFGAGGGNEAEQPKRPRKSRKPVAACP